jgi:hypothetical protein
MKSLITLCLSPALVVFGAILPGPESQAAETLKSSSLRGTPLPPSVAAAPALPTPQLSLAAPNATGSGVGRNIRIMGNGGIQSEIGIAASSDGRNIVVAANGDLFVSSQNGGSTFSAPAGWPAGGGSTQGDPSLAVGRSGRFYLAYIWNNPAPSCDFGIAVSTDNGLNFNGPVSAVTCPPSANGCFPDQETIAADRINPGSTGGDQVYLSWRQFTDLGCPSSGTGNEDATLCCSQDSGANWSAGVLVDASGDRPRPAVAPDGTVYVVYVDGDGGAVRVHRFTSCRMGLTAIPGYPHTVTGSSSVNAPPGLDRNGQEGNPMIGVDPFNSSLVYVVYANNSSGSSSGDPNVYLRISIDAGVNWSAPIKINDNLPNNTSRYFPWLAVNPADGSVNIAWYDRRDDPANNDLTSYFGARVTGGGTADVKVSRNFRVSEVNYSATATGSPCGANGCPKYGDYNAVACGPNFMYAAWASQVSPPSVQPPSTSIDVFFAVVVSGDIPQIQPSGLLEFGDVCVGSSASRKLQVCNAGKADLVVDNITSSDPRFTAAPISFPLVISPDACFTTQISFKPTSPGAKTATIRITSNDPINPTLDLEASGTGVQQIIVTAIANSGDFGDVCIGSFKDLDLTLNNSGGCDLRVTSLSIVDVTSSPGEFVGPGVVSFPLVIHAGDTAHLPIRFRPGSPFGLKTARVRIASNDPDRPISLVDVRGNAPPGDVRVTGSTDFGDVCPETLAEKNLSVCNVGKCNLSVLSVFFSPPCPDFKIINSPFPAFVSPDSCLDVVIRFTPTSCGPKSCRLVVTTDDPETPIIVLEVTANTPCPEIDVPPDLAFDPEVIQTVGRCNSRQPFPISNKGQCNLTITAITLGGVNAGDYSLAGLPSFPIILQPGHVAGEGDLSVVFAPTVVDRDREATLTVTYLSDPITGATTSVTRLLCGEGVYTGARVLVTQGGIPLVNVEKIHLQRINANRNKDRLDTQDQAADLQLITVIPAPPCEAFQYHREYGTVSNPIQLLPGSFQVTVQAIINGKRQHKTVGFNLDTCDFNPTVVVDF